MSELKYHSLYNTVIRCNHRTSIIRPPCPFEQVAREIVWPAKPFPKRDIRFLEHVLALEGDDDPNGGRGHWQHADKIQQPRAICARVNLRNVHAKDALAKTPISLLSLVKGRRRLTFVKVAGRKIIVKNEICFICHIN